jgi:hypothetical protein
MLSAKCGPAHVRQKLDESALQEEPAYNAAAEAVISAWYQTRLSQQPEIANYD